MGRQFSRKPAAKHDGRSGHKPILDQNGIVTRKHLLLSFADEAKARPQLHSRGLILIINDVCVGKDKPHFGIRREFLERALKTDGIPDIILVAQRNQVPLAKPDRTFEIGDETKVVFIAGHPHRKCNRCGKRAHDLDSAVSGAIVTNNQLIGRYCLLLNAGQLPAQKSLTVIRAKSDRDSGFHLVEGPSRP